MTVTKGQAAPASYTMPTKGTCLRPLRVPWPQAVHELLEGGEPAVVRVLIAEVRGSAPREPGTSMLVVSDGIYGTIGGGNLEWQAMHAARSLLGQGALSVRLRRLVLGRELGQCCGGVVRLWLERFTCGDLPLLRGAVRDSAILTEVSKDRVVRKLLPPGAHPRRLQFAAPSGAQAALLEPIQEARAPLWLYGAGHVAQALTHILGDLPFDVTWIDCRPELLPTSLPDNVHALCAPAPVNTVNSAPAAARFLVMTHDHALDYALCRRILERHDFIWLGLIGSKSKAARFRSRLARDGIAPEAIARLTCPIGVTGVNSKLPAAIAVAVAAQLLQRLGDPTAAPVARGLAAEPCSSPDCSACRAARDTPAGKLGNP